MSIDHSKCIPNDNPYSGAFHRMQEHDFVNLARIAKSKGKTDNAYLNDEVDKVLADAGLVVCADKECCINRASNHFSKSTSQFIIDGVEDVLKEDKLQIDRPKGMEHLTPANNYHGCNRPH